MDPWAEHGKLVFSFNVKPGSTACMFDMHWSSFALYDSAPRADRCVVTIVWSSEEANVKDLPTAGDNVVFTDWNPTLLTFDGNVLELFGGEGKRRRVELSCKLQPVKKDGIWEKYDLEFVPKSDCGVRLIFGTGIKWSYDYASEENSKNSTSSEQRVEL